MNKLLSAVSAFAAVAVLAGSAAAQTEWNGAAPTLSGSETVTITNGATGTLTVPLGGTATIVGDVDNATNGIGINLQGGGSKVVWNAKYKGNTSNSLVTVSINSNQHNQTGEFIVKDGGIIQNTGSGDAITVSANNTYVTVEDGGKVIAASGYAINHTGSSDDSRVYVTGGVAFSCGNTTILESRKANGAKKEDFADYVESNGNGVVIGWNKVAANMPYDYLSNTDLNTWPADVAFWDFNDNGDAGIAYDRNGNTGFLDASFTSACGAVEIKTIDISVNTTTVDFGKKIYGYRSVNAKTVTVSNSGNVAVDVAITIDSDDFRLSATTLNIAAGASGSFTVVPKGRLSVDTYAANIGVKATAANAYVQNDTAAVKANFKVVPAKLTIGGFGEITKVFDNNTDADIDFDALYFIGLVYGERAKVDASDVTAVYASPEAGTHTIVFTGDFKVGEGTADPKNYIVIQPSVTGEITAPIVIIDIPDEKDTDGDKDKGGNGNGGHNNGNMCIYGKNNNGSANANRGENGNGYCKACFPNGITSEEFEANYTMRVVAAPNAQKAGSDINVLLTGVKMENGEMHIYNSKGDKVATLSLTDNCNNCNGSVRTIATWRATTKGSYVIKGSVKGYVTIPANNERILMEYPVSLQLQVK